MHLTKSFVFFILIFFIGQTSALGSIALTSPARPILISHSSETFTINLLAFPSTGYGWRLKDYQEHILEPINQVFYPPQKGMPPNSRVESFIFKVKGDSFKIKRITQITFIYSRPWRLENVNEVRFNVVSQ